MDLVGHTNRPIKVRIEELENKITIFEFDLEYK